MGSQFQFVADVRDDLLLVTEERSAFFAMYENRADRPKIALVHRSPCTDQALLAAAFQAAVKKARELGGLCEPEQRPRPLFFGADAESGPHATETAREPNAGL
jgi:hypothetical protein